MVKELRDPDRLKKSKRGNVALAKFSTPVGDAAKLRKVEDILNFLRVSLNNLAASDIDTLASRDWSPAIASLIKGADPWTYSHKICPDIFNLLSVLLSCT